MKLLQEISNLQHDDVATITQLNTTNSLPNPRTPGDAVSDGPENPRIKQAIDELNKLIVSLEFSDDVENQEIIIQATALRDALKQELHKTMPDTDTGPQAGSNLAPQIFTNIG